MWCIQTSWCKLCLWELLFDMTATGYDLHLKISAGWGSTGDEAPWTNLWVPAQLWCYCFPHTLAVMPWDAEPPRYPLTGCMKAPQTRARVNWPQGTKRFGSLPVVLWMSLGCAGREGAEPTRARTPKEIQRVGSSVQTLVLVVQNDGWGCCPGRPAWRRDWMG